VKGAFFILLLYIINKYYSDYLISKNKSVRTWFSPSLFTLRTPAGGMQGESIVLNEVR
jgi:hypothetical protein